MADFIELGFTGLDKVTDKYFERAYDRVPNPQAAYKNIRNRRRSKSVDPNMNPNYQNGAYNNAGGYNNGYGQRQLAAPDAYDAGRRRPSNGGGAYYNDDGYGRNDYYQQNTRFVDDGPGQRGQSRSYDRDPSSNRGRADADDYYYEERRTRRTARSQSASRRSGRDRDRSRSRSRSVNLQSVGASVMGALVGGLVGNEAAHGDLLGTAAGAVVGAFGANRLEHKYEKRKDARMQKLWDDGKGGREERRRRRRSR